MLSMNRFPQPRIGSFTMDDNGILHLSNRPCTLRLQQLETEKILTGIARDDTYTNVDLYVLDLLQYQDSCLRQRPNSLNDLADGKAQMTAISGMRSMIPSFLQRELRNCPFVFTLTDISQANLFVDDEWNIKAIIDLEWTASLPIQMVQPPLWLNDQDLDTIEQDMDGFDEARREFMEIFRTLGDSANYRQETSCADVMERTWQDRSFFYIHALESTIEFCNIFQAHILPLFDTANIHNEDFEHHLSSCWAKDW
ncbi:MAG: hypothetical protein MMC23_002853 [Stictis urceolatum]|nr:hypothetical protein [Stictis urceolata]